MDHIKGQDLPESIGASFLNISSLEPVILKFNVGLNLQTLKTGVASPFL